MPKYGALVCAAEPAEIEAGNRPNVLTNDAGHALEGKNALGQWVEKAVRWHGDTLIDEVKTNGGAQWIVTRSYVTPDSMQTIIDTEISNFAYEKALEAERRPTGSPGPDHNIVVYDRVAHSQ